MTEIKVYSKQDCSRCKIVKMFMEQKEVPYTEVRVDLDEAGLQRLKDMNVNSLPYVEHPYGGFSGVNMPAMNELANQYGGKK